MVSVVIVNYNSWPDTTRLAGSLAQAPEVADARAEVVVVDNASHEPPPEQFVNPPRGITLVLREHNSGFAAGVNAGRRAARGNWILILNPDVVAGPNLIRQVLDRVDAFDPDSPPGLVGFGLRNPDGSRQPSVGAFPNLLRTVWEQLIPRTRRKYQAGWRIQAGPVPWVTGACMLASTLMLDDVGGMDEDFFLYYEEVALCRAAWRRGREVWYDPSVEVVHLHPLQNRTVSPQLRVITRHSKLLYFRKHLPWWEFELLAGFVAGEARVRGAWSRLRGRRAEASAWDAIVGLTSSIRRGGGPRGRLVLELAERATAIADADHSASRADLPGRRHRQRLGLFLNAWTRGPAAAPPARGRKDGPGCQCDNTRRESRS